ncbi:hypothetical protein Tco_1572279, partial [Tanacetum coccineum]
KMLADFEKEINYLKQTLSEQLKENELLTKTFNVLKNESKEKEAKNIDKVIALEKKVKELDNIVCKMGQSAQTAQQIRPMLYDGTVIAKETNVISIADSEETLILEEESRSKMLLKQNFGKQFVPQTELSGEKAFWLKSSPSSEEPSTSSTPVKTNVPKELPKTLKDTFNNFHQCLLDEITEAQSVFNQIEQAVEQCRLETKSSDIQKKQVLNKNDRLLEQIISQDIVNIVVNSFVDINDYVNVNVNSIEMCNKCLELEAELIKQHSMVDQEVYNKLLKSYSKLEQHCISLELAMQLNKEIFQKNNTS